MFSFQASRRVYKSTLHLILSCDRIHKYLTPASCLSNSGDYLDQPPAQLLLLLHLIWFRKDVMFRMLKIYFQTSRTELAAAPPRLQTICTSGGEADTDTSSQQPLQILHHFSAGGERGLQVETTQPGTPWTMWSRTTETTGRCDAEKLRASCPVNYRTRKYTVQTVQARM